MSGVHGLKQIDSINEERERWPAVSEYHTLDLHTTVGCSFDRSSSLRTKMGISRMLQPMSGTSRAVSSTPRMIKMATMKMSQIKKFLPSFIITDSYSFGFGVVAWWIKCG
jgi:hypothetical protein